MSFSVLRRVPAAALAGVLSGGAALVAQCDWQVAPGIYPGATHEVRSFGTWDPDGAGPEPALLVVLGPFAAAGGVVDGLAAFDDLSDTWRSLGDVDGGFVEVVATMPNGDLIAAGLFSSIDGVPIANIGRFDGATWTQVGGGIAGTVSALAVMPNGDLVAGGAFASAGSAAVANVARWDGVSWSGLGGGLTWPGGYPWVRDLKVLANGDLVAGGFFKQIASGPADSVARWDGTSWSPLGTGLNAAVLALEQLSNGDLVAGGIFDVAGAQATPGIARWNGAVWSGLGGGVQSFGQAGVVESLARLPGGSLMVGGSFTSAGSIAASCVAIWDGFGWSPLGAGITDGAVRAVGALPTGRLVVGGEFDFSGSVRVPNLARYDGTAWRRFGDGVDGEVRVVEALPGGGVLVAGNLRVVGAADVRSVARWDGSSWSPLGSGIPESLPAGSVAAMASLPNGDIVAAGTFVEAGGVPVNGLARWDGAQWSAMQNVNGRVRAFARRASGELLAVGSGDWGVRYWSGASWLRFAGVNPPSPTTFQAVVELPNGDVVVAGSFTSIAGTAAGGIARWDGTSWHSLAAGISGSFGFGTIEQLAVAADGSLVAVGWFDGIDGVACDCIARWDGTAWTAIGSNFPAVSQSYLSRVVALPNGDLVVAGGLDLPGMLLNGVARWNGATWSAVAQDVLVQDLALTDDGMLWVGGQFLTFDGVVTPNLARLDPQCPAPVSDLGGGCAGNTLRVERRAWLGGTWRARGTALPDPAIVPSAYGFSQTSLPLSNVLSQALAGCDLLVTPDHIALGIASGGEIVTTLAIPDTAALVGVTFYQQLVSFELDANANLVEVTASNALEVTIGSL